MLLALAAVATAWSSYQANRWNGETTKATSRVNALRIEAARAQGLAEGQTQVDIATFFQWVNATATDDDELADFYLARFRPEFRPAFDAWLATDPLTNPDAPPTPFAMDDYQLAAEADAERLDAEAEVNAAIVRRNIQRSANYVLAVVLFAVALFFAGMSTKLRGPGPAHGARRRRLPRVRRARRRGSPRSRSACPCNRRTSPLAPHARRADGESSRCADALPSVGVLAGSERARRRSSWTISEDPEMSELAGDLLVPVSTSTEVDSQLGSQKVTDAPSTNRVAAADDRLELMPGLDGRTATTSAMAIRLPGICRRRTSDARCADCGRRPWERQCQRRPHASSQTAELSGERWGAPPVVAATKLTIPRSRRPLLPRPRLHARLDEDYRLALVSAPAGYGKTAALAMWAAEHRDRVAWLSCDPADAEPTRFMAGLLAALADAVAWRSRRRLRAPGARTAPTTSTTRRPQ